jgi:hypothetical protein
MRESGFKCSKSTCVFSSEDRLRPGTIIDGKQRIEFAAAGTSSEDEVPDRLSRDRRCLRQCGSASMLVFTGTVDCR